MFVGFGQLGEDIASSGVMASGSVYDVSGGVNF
jgi:hypothetical protein